MPRKKIPFNPFVPYHIFSRSNNRDWFVLDMDTMWTLFQDQLYLPVQIFEVELFSFVLMNNHFHMLAKFPQNNMADFMQYFMRELSREIGRRQDVENHKFKARYGRSMIGTNHYFEHAYKYIYRNPVQAGLCKSPEEYKYSTLNGLLGLSKLWAPLVEDLQLTPAILEQTLGWLNTSYKQNDFEDLSRALHKSEFKLPRSASDKALHRLETERS